ncbi:MAG: 4Fe4S-binding leucine-rich repeat protein [Hyphomicrobiaceae bacterium]
MSEPSMNELGPPVDWQGCALDCAACACHGLQAQGRCRIGHACVVDRYAKRIDRFFSWNPELARDYLAHPYFEVRAVAAKHVDVFHLPQLIHDADETVRGSAAVRLPPRYLLALVYDPHREVRIRVAARLDPHELHAMIHDADYYVRQVVARRIPEGLLILLMHDEDPGVRSAVASRIGDDWLPGMAHDGEITVRREVAKRMPPGQLHLLLDDPDWRVRYEVASRAEPNHLQRLADDEDELVRSLARQRLGGDAAGVSRLVTRKQALRPF